MRRHVVQLPGQADALVLRRLPEELLLGASDLVVLVVCGVRRSRLPVWAALLAGVGGLVAIVMAELGTTVLVVSFWLYVASLVHRDRVR